MTVTENVMTEALAAGFTAAFPLDPSALEFMPEVRAMCAEDKCRSFGRSWSCPPACGTLGEMAGRAARYNSGVLLQTTAKLSDSFDFEGMAEAEKRHVEAFHALAARLRSILPDMLPMGSGGCRVCKKCTYPDSPCRFPETLAPSMEACGLLVSAVCEKCGAPYYYGPGTMTYTACVLFSEPEFKSKQNHVSPCVFSGRAAVRKRFSAPGRLENEARAGDILRAAGVSVPELYSRRGDTLVYERLEGETPLSLLEAERLPDEALLSLAAWLAGCWTALERAFGEPYSLGDIHLANFMWDGARISGFDLEECRPGYPEDDLGLLLAFIVTYLPPFSDYELNRAAFLAGAVRGRMRIDENRLKAALDAAFSLIFARRRLTPDAEKIEKAKKLLLR